MLPVTSSPVVNVTNVTGRSTRTNSSFQAIRDNQCVNSFSWSQAKTKDVRASGNGDVLVAVYGERYGGSLHSDIGRELPQCLAVVLIDGRKTTVWLPIKD